MLSSSGEFWREGEVPVIPKHLALDTVWSELRDADHMIIGPLLIGLILYLLLYLKVKESPVSQSDEVRVGLVNAKLRTCERVYMLAFVTPKHLRCFLGCWWSMDAHDTKQMPVQDACSR